MGLLFHRHESSILVRFFLSKTKLQPINDSIPRLTLPRPLREGGFFGTRYECQKNWVRGINVFILCCLLISTSISAASEAFKNSLIRMDFSKISGGIQVKLYTNKPYGDSVSVVKKSDSEYAILMPETSNSMTASPILNPVSSVVRGVSVKTQQYENGIKGYTKILITTSSPIEIVPQVKAINVSEYQLSENDYSELLAQTAKHQKSTVQKPKTKPTKTAQKTPNTKPYSKPDLNQGSRLGFPAQQHKAKNVLNAASPKKVTQTPVAKPVIKEVKKPVSQPVESAKPIQETTPVETVMTTSVPSPSPTVPPTQNALNAPESAVQQPIAPALPLTFSQKLINVAENPRLLAKYKDVVMNNLYLIGGAAIAVFLLLLLGARRMTKGIQKQKETFTKNLNESPAPTANFMDKINENMTWKEKYQTYVDASNQPQEASNESIEQTPSPFEAQEELNELFEIDSEDNFAQSQDNLEQEDFTAQSTTNENRYEPYEQLERDLLAETEVPQHEISGREDVLGKDRLDELFGIDEDVFGEENGFIEEDYEIPQQNIKPRASFYEPLNSQPVEESFAEMFTEPVAESFTETTETSIDEEQEVEEIKSEYVIDATKGFYLVNYKDSSALIGHIEDEVFVLKQFKEKIEGNLQARLDEHKGESANYMTKVGSKFKALVEVKPDNMNLLIEL